MKPSFSKRLKNKHCHVSYKRVSGKRRGSEGVNVHKIRGLDLELSRHKSSKSEPAGNPGEVRAENACNSRFVVSFCQPQRAHNSPHIKVKPGASCSHRGVELVQSWRS